MKGETEKRYPPKVRVNSANPRRAPTAQSKSTAPQKGVKVVHLTPSMLREIVNKQSSPGPRFERPGKVISHRITVRLFQPQTEHDEFLETREELLEDLRASLYEVMTGQAQPVRRGRKSKDE